MEYLLEGDTANQAATSDNQLGEQKRGTQKKEAYIQDEETSICNQITVLLCKLQAAILGMSVGGYVGSLVPDCANEIVQLLLHQWFHQENDMTFFNTLYTFFKG